MRRILATWFALGATFALTLALQPSASAQTLRIALRQELDTMDPTLSTTYVGRIVFAGLCDKLFDIDEKLNIVPQLATGYEWADPKTLVIHLRQGVAFQDGEAMDADAVKASLLRDMTLPGSYRRSEVGVGRPHRHNRSGDRAYLAEVAVGAFLAQLTDRAGMILAPNGARRQGKDLPASPCAADRSSSSSACRRIT